MKNKKIIIILIIFIFMVGTISLTLGKYIYNSVWSYYLSSNGFYFESDMLDVNTKNNSILKWDGSNVEFQIRNSENEELITEYDITYKITCEVMGEEANYIECNLNDTGSNVYSGTLSTESYCVNNIDSTDVSSYEKSECEIKGYTWYDEIAIKENYFNLQLTNSDKNIDEVSVKITAESLTPYRKKLIGVFNLNKLEEQESELMINYQMYEEYDELTFTNLSSQKKCVEINFDASDYAVDLDTKITEYSLDSSGKVNQVMIEISKEESIVKGFYKVNLEKDYSINDFVIVDKEC